MTQALAELASLCLCMGLVIMEVRPNFSHGKRLTVLMYNGQRLERVTNNNYLGMYISFHSTQSAVNYVRNIYKVRLKPLKVLTNTRNGCGVGLSVLRIMYISTIRSIIDYAAPVFICPPQKSLQALEVVQNEAMKTV